MAVVEEDFFFGSLGIIFGLMLFSAGVEILDLVDVVKGDKG